ncbi:YgfZ/GcvT domain-containing protein [Nannocystaceae bacterium ST9]
MPTPLRHVFLAEVPGQDRVLLRLTGDDAPRFLQGLLTADVGQLTVGRALPAALLTVKGKIVSEVIVLSPRDAEIWLAIPRELVDAVQAQLEGHVIMDDVVIERLDHALALVWGGSIEPSMASLAGVVSFATEHPLHGHLLVGPRTELDAWLSGQGGELVDAPTFTALRIDQARPAWGHELVPDRFPPEVGFVDAVSYTKGCYMGQEPLSRIHNRGQVNRVMVRVEAERAPDESTGSIELFLAESEDPVGEWTSRVGARGLAIIKRKHAEPGKPLRTASGVALKVSSGPLGDDPGGPGRTVTKVQLGGRR